MHRTFLSALFLILAITGTGRPPAAVQDAPASSRAVPVGAGRDGAAQSKPAAEVLYSGPQKGEKVRPFSIVNVTTPKPGMEFDPVAAAGDAPSLYFFFPSDVSRIVSRAISNIGALAGEAAEAGLKSYFIGLCPDPLAAEQRLRDVWSSRPLRVVASLSKDGVEGPGNWGLNKKCDVTVILVKNGTVVFNYAALAPADSDYEVLREEIGRLVDRKLVAELVGGPGMRGGMQGEGRPLRDGARAGRQTPGTESRASRPASAPKR